MSYNDLTVEQVPVPLCLQRGTGTCSSLPAERNKNTLNAKPDLHVCIIIPSLNPEPKFVDFIKTLSEQSLFPIVIVDDGSSEDKKSVFHEAAAIPGVTLLEHFVNLGKGRALKTAFNYCIGNFPKLIGVVTADADGQHLCSDIIKCCDALMQHPDDLILGCRDFHESTPWKSKVGNVLTRNIFYFVSGGRRLTDTQTGLRGIPLNFMKSLMNCPGERFEYETEMLLSAVERRIKYFCVPIETVYMNDNRETHFDPLRDSLRIYKVLFAYSAREFIKFIVCSLSSAALDIGLFALLFYIVCPCIGVPKLFWSVLIARLCSSFYNYCLNKSFVFRSGKGAVDVKSLLSYYSLCAMIFLASYGLTRWALSTFSDQNSVLLKISIDIILFIITYIVQKIIVFKRTGRDK